MGRSLVPFCVVCGPAGAGKAELVSKMARPGELVVDVEPIKAELAALPLFHAPHAEWMERAMRERNARLFRLSQTAPPWQKAWLITGAPRASDRRWWREIAGARVILVMPSLDACRARLAADERRPPAARAEAIAAAEEWFKSYTADPHADELVGADREQLAEQVLGR